LGKVQGTAFAWDNASVRFQLILLRAAPGESGNSFSLEDTGRFGQRPNLAKVRHSVRRRRLDNRKLLALLGCVLMFGLGVHFLHGYQVKRQAGGLLKQANRAEQQKQYQTAIDYLRRYLGFQPRDTDTLARYGRLLAREDVSTNKRAAFRALAVLESLLRRDPARGEDRRLVIELSLRLEAYKDAQYHLEYLLRVKGGRGLQQQLDRALNEDPSKGDLFGKLAACHEAQRNYSQARDCYELAVGSAPGDVASCVGLAHLLRDHGEEVLRPGKEGKDRETLASLQQRADQLLDRLVNADTSSPRGYVARAQYRRRYPLPAGREATLEAVERDLRQALKLAGDDAEVLLGLAELAGDRNDPSAARELLLRGLAGHRRDWRMYLALSRLEWAANRHDEGLSHLRKGLKVLPGHLELLWDYADLLIASGSDEAPAAVKQLQRKGVPQPELDVLSARLLIRQRKWAEALQLLVSSYPKLAGRDGLARSASLSVLVEQCGFLLTQCYERLGDPYRAGNVYRRILAGNPRSLEARLGLARAHAALGRGREAESQYRQLAQTGNPRALIEAARLVLERNAGQGSPDWEEVDEALKQAERLQPRPVEVALLRAEALLAEGEFKKARGEQAELEKALEKARGVLAVSALGAVPVWTGLLRPEMLPAAALPPPKALAPLWVGLSILEERAGRPQAALELLDEAGKKFGDLPDLRQARVRYWVRQGWPRAAAPLAALERDPGGFRPEERRQLRTGLALAYTSLGQPERARRLWEGQARDHPDDWAARLVQFNLPLERNDEEAMDRLLGQLQEIERGDGVLWRDATVRRLLLRAGRGDRSSLPGARKLTAEIAARWPGWVGVTLHEAQIADLAGQPERALLKYRAAIDRGGATVHAVWRAMAILNSQQRFREAAALRRKLPGKGRFSAGLEQVAALASLRANDDAEALARAERAVDRDPKSPAVHLLLGHIYWRAARLDEAHSALSKARDLDDRAPEAWVSLIGFLAATGKKAQASAELDRASMKLAGTRGVLALAQCYEVVGEKDKAGRVYASAQIAGSADLRVRRAVAGYHLRAGKPAAARPHLDFLVKAAQGKEPDTVVWARGMLAVLAALGGHYAETRDALRDLEQSGARDTGAGVLGQRTRAAVLATRGNARDRGEAIRILQGLIDGGVDEPTDRLLLARLHETNNDWPKARQHLVSLLKTPGGNAPASLVAYASAMLRHGELTEAEQALDQFEKAPKRDELTFVSLKAQLWHRRGKEKEAVALLEGYAAKAGRAFGQLATVLEGLNEHQAAERMYRLHAEKASNPSATLAYAHFLARRKRCAEALDVCERAWAKSPPALVADACLSILEAARDDKAVQARVERQLQAALEAHPRLEAIRLSLANLRVTQRRYDDAEAIYRGLLEKDSQDFLAHNNLAWMLACRKKQVPAALKLIEEAITAGGPRAMLLDTQALAFLAAGKTRDAVRLLERLVAESPEDATHHFHLAQAQMADRDRRGAALSLRRARLAGLKVEALHPLELQGYQRLVRDLRVAARTFEE
jgi:predicted Zn-dependent protease